MRSPALTALTAAGPSAWARLTALARMEKRELAVVFVLAAGLGLLSLAVPITAQAVIRTVAIGGMGQQLVVLGGVLTVGLLFAVLLEVAQMVAVEAVSRRLFLRVVDDFAERMVGLDRARVGSATAAERVHRFFDIVTVEKTAAAWLFDGLAATLKITVGLALLAAYHPWLLLLDLVIIGAVGLILSAAGRGAMQSAIEESKRKYALAAWLERLAEDDGNHWGGQGSDRAAAHNQGLAGAWLQARRRHFRALMWQVSGMLVLQVAVSVAVLVLGGLLVLNRELDLGQLVAAELVTAATVAALGKVGKLLGKGYDLLAAIDKIGAVVDLPVAASGDDLPTAGALTARVTNTAPWPMFDVRPQEPVAVLEGQGGAGGALVACLAGFADPPRGAILLAETDIADLDRDALTDRVRRIRPLPIATGTVKELLGAHLRPDCSKGELRAALAEVGLVARIDRLPRGLDTEIQRDGVLSPAERVLLDTAALRLSQPGLVVVDGALDALDDTSRQAVLGVLCDPDGPWSVLVRTARPEVAQLFNTRISLPMPSEAS
ncbi:MAG: ABC transporter ATP-binding protein [Myxococcales bacterium]|nr:ABC transporter ATP-binding protein [Myxococcales bacterium]